MEEQELKNIWKSSSQVEHVIVDMMQLIKDFKVDMEHREHIVRRRDRREIIAAIIGILAFGYSFYAYPYYISRSGCILGTISMIYIIYKLHNNRKSKFTKKLFLSIQDQLKKQRQFMLNQAKLLSTVLYWAMIPLYTANLLIFWGASKSELPLTLIEQLFFKWEIKLIISLVLAAFFGYIAWMNKKAAKVNWRPLIKKIDRILSELEE